MYGKHFQSMYTGSMHGAGPDVFAVWGYVISHAQHGTVELNPQHLAPILGMSAEAVEATIVKLAEPDNRSRSKAYDGRRLIPAGAFSYIVPTHEFYRSLRTSEDRRAYMTEYMRNRRKGLRGVNSPGKHVSLPEPEAETDKRPTTAAKVAAEGAFEEFWKAYPKRGGGPNPKGRARKAWNARMKNGATPEIVMAGLTRYVRYMHVKGKLHTDFVMQAATFLGPDEHYLESYAVPSKPGAPVEAVAICPKCQERVSRGRWTPHWLSHRLREDEPSFFDHSVNEP